jgi:hypothetical protein
MEWSLVKQRDFTYCCYQVLKTLPLFQMSCLPPCFLILSCVMVNSRDSSVGIAFGYGLDCWGSRVRFPVGTGNFSIHHRVQKGSGARPASYPMGTSGSFLPLFGNFNNFFMKSTSYEAPPYAVFSSLLPLTA